VGVTYHAWTSENMTAVKNETEPFFNLKKRRTSIELVVQNPRGKKKEDWIKKKEATSKEWRCPGGAGRLAGAQGGPSVGCSGKVKEKAGRRG